MKLSKPTVQAILKLSRAYIMDPQVVADLTRNDIIARLIDGILFNDPSLDRKELYAWAGVPEKDDPDSVERLVGLRVLKAYRAIGGDYATTRQLMREGLSFPEVREGVRALMGPVGRRNGWEVHSDHTIKGGESVEIKNQSVNLFRFLKVRAPEEAK